MQRTMIIRLIGGVLLIFLSIVLIEIALSYLESPIMALSVNYPDFVDRVHTSLNFLFFAGMVFLTGYTLILWPFRRGSTKSIEEEF
ncbi:MAG: hypothetical protein JSV04_05065 [Candidatus Heimdallarchaeota archaeon]|nr:MAG: hypothetical protein JSV04_05065 [Candidatus Heimdallarchaeota archaeon]